MTDEMKIGLFYWKKEMNDVFLVQLSTNAHVPYGIDAVTYSIMVITTVEHSILEALLDYNEPGFSMVSELRYRRHENL